MASDQKAAHLEESNQGQNWFKDKSASQQAPLNEALQDREPFRRRIEQYLKRNGVRSQTCTTKEGLQDQLDDLSVAQLEELATGDLKLAGRQLSFYRVERVIGAKKIGHSAQNFVKVFTDFLGAYSGIISLVKNAGPGYGEVAYETMSLFLSVFVNKSLNDSKFNDLVRELSKAFPQLDQLSSIYPSSSIQTSVALVYKEVIVFARQATTYFTRLSVRIWMSIGRPPSIGIDNTASTIKGKLADVNSQAMVLLHARTRAIQTTLEEGQAENNKAHQQSQTEIRILQQKNDELLCEMQYLRQQNDVMKLRYDIKTKIEDEERLERLQSNLQIEYPCDETNYTISLNALLECFPLQRTQKHANELYDSHPTFNFQHMTPDRLDSDSTIQSWLASPTSSLLYLCGKTSPDSCIRQSSTCSWLSPAATYIAGKHTPVSTLMSVEAPPRDVCLYYSCQPSLHAKHDGKYDVMSLLGCLLCDALTWQPSVLRRWSQRLRQQAEKMRKLQTGPDNTRKEAVRLMVRLLHDIVSEAQKTAWAAGGTVWIVIDRLDQCDTKLRWVMDELAEVAASDKCNVKILVVVDSVNAESKWDFDELEREVRAHVVPRVDWDQERLADWVHDHSFENLLRARTAVV